MRNPTNYLHQRVRVVGVYAGSPYRYDGTLLEILPQKEVPDGKRTKILGPALVIDLGVDIDTGVRREPVPTPAGMTPEQHVRKLQAQGKIAYLYFNTARRLWQAVVRTKEPRRATATIPCCSVADLHTLDWVDDEPTG